MDSVNEWVLHITPLHLSTSVSIFLCKLSLLCLLRGYISHEKLLPRIYSNQLAHYCVLLYNFNTEEDNLRISVVLNVYSIIQPCCPVFMSA